MSASITPALADLARLDATSVASGQGARHFTRALDRLIAATRAGEDVCLELDALPSEALAHSVALARRAGLLRPLSATDDWAAGVAAYHLARALPAGEERAHLSDQLDRTLEQGPGKCVARLLAARAVCERRMTPQAQHLWRQVSLCFAHDMLCEGAQQLALAVLGVHELHESWLVQPATGTLARRVLTGQLLASAAHGAALGARAGEEFALSLMSSNQQHALRQRLLFDREPLVWQLAALARGWLAPWSTQESDAIQADLAPELSPTEWRRAGLSLVARAAFSPDPALQRIEAMQADGLFESDTGLAAVMLHGLWGAPDSQATRAIGHRLLELAGATAAPELVALLWRCDSPLVRHLARQCARPVRGAVGLDATGTPVRCELAAQRLQRMLGQGTASGPGIASTIRGALDRFWDEGPTRAFPEATEALTRANDLLDVLRAHEGEQPGEAWSSLDGLLDLQQALLGDASLESLLALGPSGREALTRLDYFRVRLTHVLLLSAPPPKDATALELQRERAVAMIRVLDCDVLPGSSWLLDGSRCRAVEVLLHKLREPEHPGLRRPLCAAVARAVDGLVRTGEWECADAVLVAGVRLPDVDCCLMMAEASMRPELGEMLTALHACFASPSGLGRSQDARMLSRLQQALPSATGPRLRALRLALVDLGEALEGTPQHRPGRCARALQALELLVGGLTVKLTGCTPGASHDWQRLVADLHAAVARQGDAQSGRAEASASLALGTALLSAFPGAAGSWLRRLVFAALDGEEHATEASPTRDWERLPPWLPATREIGDYVVLRGVGSGAGGSVFLTKRRGQQLRKGAPTYALKVPEAGSGATHLSPTRFLEMFRAEAGALASLPSHPNLAALESFDRSALPVPFLVMEHVHGPSLEAEIASGAMPLDRALRALLGVARGLSVMHAHGMGHLDLKPSNVILRARGTVEEAVLVDFGLAGRRVRAGCGTLAYAAPEVFGAEAEGADPRAADVYSFAVLAYEVLTGRPLFAGPNDLAYLAQHLSHDGNPDGLDALSAQPMLAPLLPTLGRMLRQTPGHRCQIEEVLELLTSLVADLAPAPPAHDRQRQPQGAGAPA